MTRTTELIGGGTPKFGCLDKIPYLCTMELQKDKIEELRALISTAPQHIVIVSHTNPDGDALGSSLAWASALRTLGHKVHCIVPNNYPYYLNWMPAIKSVLLFKEQPDEVQQLVEQAGLLFCLDMSDLSRLDSLSDTIASNRRARRILIDHHLSPSGGFDLQFSYPDCSSTSFLVYQLIEALFGTKLITLSMAEQLYVGMMTDTGNFAFSYLTPELFRAVAVLIERGISIPLINTRVYNSYTVGRARLFGYTINCKMKLIHNNRVAYMSLTNKELLRFHFQQGEAEGFVNYPLTIKRVKMSAMFLAHTNCIRVSLRSRGNIDVNLFARKYFNGGGHKNAAGGKSFLSMEETIAHYIRSVEEFAAEGHL